MRTKHTLLAATILATSVSPTIAQQVGAAGTQSTNVSSSSVPTDATDAANTAGDIIVTARKRQESVLKVPVVMSVLDAKTLQQAAISDIRTITARVPGLIIGNSVGSVGAQISLRGIGTSALDAGIDQSVSLNIDGQQFSQGLAFRSGVFDLAQVQVLKGPQALFFGKNSPGGVIALTTADPGSQFELIGSTSYEFESREKLGDIIISGPVTDTLGLRLAARYSDNAGFFHNTAIAIPNQGGLTPRDDRYGGNKEYIIRGTAVWRPIPEFRARLKINATSDDSRGGTGELQFTSCPNGAGPSALGPQFIGGCKEDRNYEIVDLDPRYFVGNFKNGENAIGNGQPFTDSKQQFGVLELTYNQPSFDLTSTTTYYHISTTDLFNGTMSGAAGPALSASNRFKRHDTTQELRAESTWNRPINWMIGGYYQDGKMYNEDYVAGNQAILGPAAKTLTAGDHDVKIRSGSIFGQLRWKPVSKLEFAAGVRWTSERRSDVATTLNQATGVYAVVPLVTPKIHSNNWAPEATITYTPSDQMTVFAAYKTGYKSGSYSVTTPATAGVDNSFGDEKVKGGEIGLKTRTVDRALNANIAFYYYKYNGLQVGVSQTSNTNIPVLRTLNAGAARTYGIDFDTSYRPPEIQNLALNLAVNWNRAKYLRLDNVPCYGGQTIALGCNQSFNPTQTYALAPGQTGFFTGFSASGEPLEHAPQWVINAGADYEIPVGSSMKLAFGASGQYSSRYKTIIGPREDYYQADYVKANAYITLKDVRGRWEVSLIGNNLNNALRAGYCANSNGKDTVVFGRFTQVTGGATNPTGKIDDVECGVDPGRELYLRLTLRPGGWFR